MWIDLDLVGIPVQIDCWLGSGRQYAVHKRVRIRVRIKNDRQFIFQAYTECGRHG